MFPCRLPIRKQSNKAPWTGHGILRSVVTHGPDLAGRMPISVVVKAKTFRIVSTSLVYISPPLWSSGLSSWLQIRRPGFDSRHYQKKKVVGLKRGPLSLVSTTEELLGRKSSGSCLENREYGSRDPSRWPRGTLYPQKLATTSPTSGGPSVGIVPSRTQTMEFVCSLYYTK
jgi:hypothetical protein